MVNDTADRWNGIRDRGGSKVLVLEGLALESIGDPEKVSQAQLQAIAAG